MSLTVKEILEKTFQRSFKGYNEDEVDQFLDQVIDEFKRLAGQVKTLEDRNAELSRALEDEKKNRGKIKDAEETIMNTLVTAQKSSERMLRDAARKAELIIGSAENTAKQRVAQSEQELQEAQSRIEDIKRSAKAFASEFTGLINTTAAAFSEKYRSSFDDTPPSGINAAALQKINEEVADGLKDIAPEAEPGIQPSMEEIDEQPAEAQLEGIAQVLAQDAFDNTPEDIAQESEGVITEVQEGNLDSAEDEAEALADDVYEGAPADEAEEDTIVDEAKVPDEREAEEADDNIIESVDVETEDIPSAAGSEQKTGLMELHEINKALSELEDVEDVETPEEDGTQDNTQAPPFSDYKQKYNDYSWLYESDGQANGGSPVKDPDDKDELKSLIDEIID